MLSCVSKVELGRIGAQRCEYWSVLRMPTDLPCYVLGQISYSLLALLLPKFFIVPHAMAFSEEEVLGIVIYFAIFLEAPELCFYVGKSFNVARL